MSRWRKLSLIMAVPPVFERRHGTSQRNTQCSLRVMPRCSMGAWSLRSTSPGAFLGRMRQFQRSHSTVKINYALSSPVPWSDQRAAGAGTVHVAENVDELTTTASELSAGLLPTQPFLLIGQMTTADPTRSPPGTESLWTYTHVPQGIVGDGAKQITAAGRLAGPALEEFVERMEQRIEDHAPGFRNTVMARNVQGPDELERQNPSVVGGDISGGTAQLHQQLIFRPVPGLARSETPIANLYLASPSAHPGGSVHGASGANAARAAVFGRQWRTAQRIGTAGSSGVAALGVARAWRRR